MKLHKISLALVLGLGALTSCDSKLDVTNPNQPTAEIFGHNVADLKRLSSLVIITSVWKEPTDV